MQISPVQNSEGEDLPTTGFCELNSNQILIHLNQYIYIPTLIMRLFAYIYLPKLEAEKVKEASSYLSIYFHGSYGSWCLYNISRFRASSELCKLQAQVSIIAYQFAIICGVYSASLVLIAAIILIIAIPLVSYLLWRNYRDRTAQSRKTKQLMKKLLSVQYNHELFKNAAQECSICLDIYSSTAVESKVTPLPCSEKHLFHTVCLKGWLTRDDQENKCPICRKLIDDQEYQTFAKEFEQKQKSLPTN